MRTITVMCVLALVLFAEAQVPIKDIGKDPIGDQTVGVWSPWYQFRLNGNNVLQTTGETLTVDISVTTGSAELSTTTIQFDSYTLSGSFRLKTLMVGAVQLTYTVSGSVSGDYRTPLPSNFVSYYRTVTVEQATSLVVGYPSEPLQISLKYASSSQLTFYPEFIGSALQIIPSEIIIPAGSLSGPFHLLASDKNSTFSIIFTKSGEEADLYSNATSNYFGLTVVKRTFTVSSIPSDLLVGRNSTKFYISAPPVNNSVTITPYASDSTFYPREILFQNSNTTVVPFQFITHTPTPGSNTKPINFILSGDGANDYEIVSTVDVSFSQKTIHVRTPTNFVLGVRTTLHVVLAAPVEKDLQVFFYAANLAFSPNNVTFSGSHTSAVVSVIPQSVGPDNINFLVTGADESLYKPLSPVSLSVVGGQFVSPANWYIPQLFVGTVSPKVPVRVNVPPRGTVNLTLSAPDIIFDPPTLSFDGKNIEQFFTAYAVLTNSDPSLPAVVQRTVTFLVSGEDRPYFSTPVGFTITVNRNIVQLKWSAHVVKTTDVYTQVYLQKKYIIWATVTNPPQNHVTVTPTTPWISFEPAVLNFTAEVTRIQVTATVTGTPGILAVDYMLGGTDGAFYYVASQQLIASLRPLSIYQAVIAPDTRVTSGVLIDVTSAAYLSNNHVYSFSVSSTVIPESSVTITPKSHHATFSPSSITLNSGNGLVSTYTPTTLNVNNVNYYFNVTSDFVSANFTANPQAAGLFHVWFELSGPDANYYKVPPFTNMLFNQVMYPRSEVSPMSSASQVTLSLFAAVLSVLFLLV